MYLTNGDMQIIKDSLICHFLENDRIITRTDYKDVAESYKKENAKINQLFIKLFNLSIDEYFKTL